MSIEQIDDPRARNFFERAKEHLERSGRLSSDYPVIKPKTPQWKAWFRYFAQWRWVPVVMRESTTAKALTMPEEWPHEFDPAWTESRHWGLNQFST